MCFRFSPGATELKLFDKDIIPYKYRAPQRKVIWFAIAWQISVLLKVVRDNTGRKQFKSGRSI